MRVKRSRLPLTALRCFEAAGRHESFSKAADELAVSQAAVSRQVRDLEGLLGRRLFVRGHRQVRLHDHGARLLGQLTSSFDAIEALLDEIISQGRPERITVSVEPSFASLWLLPRLEAFTASHPDIEVQIDATAALARLRAGGPTLAIRHSSSSGRSSWPGTQARHLCSVEVTPMVSPSLAGARRFRDPADLQGLALLCDENGGGWSAWLDAAGAGGLVPVRGPTFSNSAIATEAAELGQGVVLGSTLLAKHRLADGRLCAPFELAVPDGAYWLLAVDFETLDGAEQAFCRWLFAEMNAPDELVRSSGEGCRNHDPRCAASS